MSVKLMVTYTDEEAQERVKHWQVIVEMWDRKSYGKGRRLYHAAFNESERAAIASQYSKLYQWFMMRGIPQEVTVSINTGALLDRATNFFGTL